MNKVVLNKNSKNFSKYAIMTALAVVVAMLVLSAVLGTNSDIAYAEIGTTTYNQLCKTEYNEVKNQENLSMKFWQAQNIKSAINHNAPYDNYDYVISVFVGGNEESALLKSYNSQYQLSFGTRCTDASSDTRFIKLSHWENSVDYIVDFEKEFVRYNIGRYLVVRANEDMIQFLDMADLDNNFDNAELFVSFDKDSVEYQSIYSLLSYADGAINIGEQSLEEKMFCYRTMEAPTKEGYTFIGWFYDEDCTIPYRGEFITDDTKLYAGFEIKKFVVTFDASGIVDPEDTNTQGLYDWTSIVEYGGTAKYGKDNHDMGLPNIDEVPNVRFAGWYFEDGKKYEDDPIHKDTTLYARFYCLVSFDLNGGEGEIAPIEVAYGSKIALPEDPTKERHGFECWSVDGIAFGEDNFVKGDMTLVAKWYRNLFCVTFYVDDEVWKQVDVELGKTLYDVTEALNVDTKAVVGFESLNDITYAIPFSEYNVTDDMAVYLSDNVELPQEPTAPGDNVTNNVFVQFWENVKAFFVKIGQWFKNVFSKLAFWK